MAVEHAAEQSGFSWAHHLRRVWRRLLGSAPTRARTAS